MRKSLKLLLFVTAAGAATQAGAASFIVRALENSSSGGTGVASLALASGQAFKVSVDPNDLWNAGSLPRWSNADGLTGPRFATGSDDSGQAAGTQISDNFGIWSQNGLDAPYGTLVGEIGNVYKVLGTSFDGSAWASGTLNLYYWDSNSGDNTQFITAAVTAVPEPAGWAMMFGGLGLLGWTARRHRTVRTVTA